jgi:alpha-beta hydrolase superfamily lysophospholipase
VERRRIDKANATAGRLTPRGAADGWSDHSTPPRQPTWDAGADGTAGQPDRPDSDRSDRSGYDERRDERGGSAMLIDVQLITTADGVQLPVGFLAPTGEKRGDAIDAVVLNGGTGTNFWHPTITDVARVMTAAGYPALTISTRGHDLAFRGRHGLLGAAYETVAECSFDFTAAIQHLVDRGYQRIALYGHSLGSTKATYYAAHAPHPALAALVALAGPRFSASWYEASPWAEQYRATKRQAEALVAAGRPNDLFDAAFPTAQPFSAASWLDQYGGERYNLAQWAQHLRAPVLRLDCGLDDGLMAYHMAGQFEEIARLAPNPHHRHVVLEGVDHFFTRPGSAEQVGRAVVAWLDALPRP